MGATGHFMTKKGGSGSHQKEITVSAADTTIDVERVEEGGLIDFKLKTTFDGLETLGGGSGSRNGYFRVVHVKFNNVNKRYRLVCILNGGSYSYCRKDFAFYLIKMGYETGGTAAEKNHAYIAEYARSNNDTYVALEQVSLTEFNILIHTARNWTWGNIGIMKEDKEPDVLIEHFSDQAHTVTGTIVPTERPQWQNGATAYVAGNVMKGWFSENATSPQTYKYLSYALRDTNDDIIGISGHSSVIDVIYAGENSVIEEEDFQNRCVPSVELMKQYVKGIIPVRNRSEIPTVLPGMLGHDYDGDTKLFVGIQAGQWREIISQAYRLSNLLSIEPQNAVDGYIYFNTTTKQTRFYYSGNWYTLGTDEPTVKIMSDVATVTPGILGRYSVNDQQLYVSVSGGQWRQIIGPATSLFNLLASAPANASDGYIYFDTTTNKIMVRYGNAWHYAGADESALVKSVRINGTNHTPTNGAVDLGNVIGVRKFILYPTTHTIEDSVSFLYVRTLPDTATSVINLPERSGGTFDDRFIEVYASVRSPLKFHDVVNNVDFLTLSGLGNIPYYEHFFLFYDITDQCWIYLPDGVKYKPICRTSNGDIAIIPAKYDECRVLQSNADMTCTFYAETAEHNGRTVEVLIAHNYKTTFVVPTVNGNETFYSQVGSAGKKYTFTAMNGYWFYSQNT